MLLQIVFLLSIVKYIVALLRGDVTEEELNEDITIKTYSCFMALVSLFGLIVKCYYAYNDQNFASNWIFQFIIVYGIANMFKNVPKVTVIILLLFNVYMYLVITDKIYPII